MMHKPQSVLMTADTVGGVWTYALELTRALQTHGVEVQLALMGPPLKPEQRAEAERIPNLSLFKSNYKLEWMPDCWSDVRRAGDWLLHLATRLSPDVIHLNGYAHAALPWSSPTLVVAHSCVFSWWDAVRGNAPPAEWQQYKREVTSGLQAAHIVVAPSNMMLNAIQRHYGKVYESRVIPNGRDAKSFRPAPKQNFILCAGRLWDAGKNIARVDEIASELPWPVFVAGDSKAPQRNGQKVFAKDRCHLLGLLDEVTLSEWFATAAIYALPALYEPFGYTPLEAGLSQCALVLGDIESLRENWEGAAVFVDPHDSQELKKAIMGLVDNDSYRIQMSRLARQRALEFSPRRMANDYLAVYSDLLKRFRRLHREERLVQCA